MKQKLSISISEEAFEYLQDEKELLDRSISWLVDDAILRIKKNSTAFELKIKEARKELKK